MLKRSTIVVLIITLAPLSGLLFIQAYFYLYKYSSRYTVFLFGSIFIIFVLIVIAMVALRKKKGKEKSIELEKEP